MAKLSSVGRLPDGNSRKSDAGMSRSIKADSDNHSDTVHDSSPSVHGGEQASFFSFPSADAPLNSDNVDFRRILLSVEDLKKYPAILPSVSQYCECRGMDCKKLVDVDAFCAPRGRKLPFLKHSLYYDTIFFPTKDNDGNVIHAVYRPISTKSKNYVTAGRKPLYLVPSVRLWSSFDSVVACEGIWDALSVWQAGFPAVALLGSSIQSNRDLSCFEGRNCLVALDGDLPHEKLYRVAFRLKGIASSVRILADVPSGMDLNDVLVSSGETVLRELLEYGFQRGEVVS